jgi:hypothetical protein
MVWPIIKIKNETLNIVEGFFIIFAQWKIKLT